MEGVHGRLSEKIEFFRIFDYTMR